MNPIVEIGLVVIGGIVIMKLMHSGPALATPSAPATYPVVQPIPQNNDMAGYGQLAAGIGQGLGGLFSGIGSLVNASNSGGDY